MAARTNLKRAPSAIEDATAALNRAKHTDDRQAARLVRRALAELEDADTRIRKAIRELPAE